MKTHISISATNLAKSVEFYTLLLDAKPEKFMSDYALFVVDDPALELALVPVESAPATGDTHYGICVESAKDVERAIQRLDQAGLVASIESESTCCYAVQTKVWTADPDGRPWEVYTVHAEANEPASMSCCDSEAGRPEVLV